MRLVLAATFVCAALVLLSSGCRYGSSVTLGRPGPYASHGRDGHGPPPHAPAHGHRRKVHVGGDEVQLSFDASLGVYVVIDVPDHYYWDGHYLRVDNGRWYVSAQLAGDWKPHSWDALPPGLRKKYARHGKLTERPDKGHVPAKGHW